jgi:protein-L-isoaspartate(D-aspartate) O-methyltransferase
MTDFAAARAFMVQGQVRVNDVTDPRLTMAMLEVPRERFVPSELAALAYLDQDLQLIDGGAGARRYLLKPLMLAKLIQAAEIEPGDHVLDVGCGTGYAAALLARLARDVIALEENGQLARHAVRDLVECGTANVAVVTGPLREGWAAAAPYDAIVVEGRTEIVPDSLLAQLRDGGRLVCVQGGAAGAKGMVYRSLRGDATGWPLFEAVAPLLPGFAEPAAFVF